MGVGAAAAIGGAAALGGSIFSGIMSASGAKRSAEAIRYAAELGRKTALELNEKARADLAPFRETGVQAAGQLSDILSGKTTADQLFKDSAQFRFESDIGQRNINRQLAARGGYNSGAGLEALSLFNASLVGAEGEKQFQRIFNTATLGSNAAAQSASNTTSTGNTIANLSTQSGLAQAGAIQNQYSAIGGIGQGIGQTAQGLTGQYANYSLYQPLIDRYARAPFDPRTSFTSGVGQSTNTFQGG